MKKVKAKRFLSILLAAAMIAQCLPACGVSPAAHQEAVPPLPKFIPKSNLSALRQQRFQFQIAISTNLPRVRTYPAIKH